MDEVDSRENVQELESLSHSCRESGKGAALTPDETVRRATGRSLWTNTRMLLA